MPRKLVFLVYVLALWGVGVLGGVSAQDIVPPQVIDVSPPPGAELTPQQPVIVTFDQSMNQDSVATALRVVSQSVAVEDPNPVSLEASPAGAGATAVPGSVEAGSDNIIRLDGSSEGGDQGGTPITVTLNWADARTVQILPSDGWERDRRYNVEVAGTAQAESGAALGGVYRFNVHVQGFLEIAQITPGANSRAVAVDTPIVIAFNRAVVPLVSTDQQSDLPAPIVISPDVAGIGEWINTSVYRFTPASPLAGGTTYTVTAAPNLQAMDGTVLAAGFAWSFTTLPPSIAYVNLAGREDVVANTDVVIEFTQPMDRPSTETAFSLMPSGGAAVQGGFAWDEAGRTMTFTPRERLELETSYVIAIDDSARGAGGNATLETPYVTTFTSQPYPAVASTNPEAGATINPQFSQIQLRFRSPMNFETFRDRIVIEPEPASVIPRVYDYAPQSLMLQARLDANTEYTVTLLAGVEDTLGNAIPEDYTFSFQTGALDPVVVPAINGDFMVTNAYREDARIAVNVTGQGAIDFTLNPITAETIASSKFGMYTDPYYGPSDLGSGTFYASEFPMRSWQVAFDSGDKLYVPEQVFLASDQGGQLPLGLYYMTAYAPRMSYYTDLVGFVLAVSTANVEVKRTPTEILVWVTDMQTGEPLANVPVNALYRPIEAPDPGPWAQGTTDEQGLFRAAVDMTANTVEQSRESDSSGFLLVTAGDPKSDVFGAWYSGGEPQLRGTQGYLYTDRPLYRPGEAVYFRGVLRQREDMNYSIPDVKSVVVRLTKQNENTVLAEMPVNVTEFGTFSGSFTIPEGGELGSYSIQVDWGRSPFYTTQCYPYSMDGVNDFDCYSFYSQGISFEVSEFRVPEYEVIATTLTPDVVQDEPFSAQVAANYYFGGSVEGANVHYTVNLANAGFFYPSDEGVTYDFTDSQYTVEPTSYEGDAQTDQEGVFTLTEDAPRIVEPRTLSASVTMAVTDESGIVISDQTLLTIHPSSVYVGLARGGTSRFAQVGEPFTTRLITVSPEREIVPNQPVELEVVESRWEQIELGFGRYEWQQHEYPVTTGSATTDAEGHATFEFVPPNAGVFIVRANIEDAEGRPNASALNVWALGDSAGRQVFWGNPARVGGGLRLTLDKETHYQPGDSARLLIEMPETGTWTAWITLERAQVMFSDVIAIEGSSTVYDLPLVEDYAPDATLTVTAVRGPTETSPNPIYRVGSVGIFVEPVLHQLNVVVTPSERQFGPGEAVSFDVHVTDQQGNGVRAEVGLAVTDEAVLALMPTNSASIETTFYGDQPDYVRTNISLAGLLDALTDATLYGGGMGGGGGGGGEAANFNVRRDFKFTPLWTTVVTDENGFGTVQVEMPDNLTRWRVDARVVSLDTAVGSSLTNVTSTLPLLVRPAVPRFFVVGDRVELAAVINNNTDMDQVVTAHIEATGVTFDGVNAQQVTIPAGGRARVAWHAVVQDTAGVGLVFYAEDTAGYQDAVQPMLADENGLLPVYRYTSPDTVGTAGAMLEPGTRVEGVALPPHFDETRGDLTVRVDPTLAVTILDTLKVNEDVTNRCNEIVVSSFLPDVVMYRALTVLDIADPAMLDQLTTILHEAENTLSHSQNADGGWGWCRGSQSSSYTTAYALLGVAAARDAGFDFGMGGGGGGNGGGGGGDGGDSGSSQPRNPPGVISVDDALAFLETYWQNIDDNTPAWVLNNQIFTVYVRSQLIETDKSILKPFFDNRTEMSVAGRAYLLLSYLETAPNAPEVLTLRDDLVGLAILSATGVQWEELDNDWQSWTSDTRTTALATLALTRADPTNPLLPGAVRWLLQARRGDTWSTTQETAWSLIAFTDWMRATGELDGNYTYTLILNDTELAAGQVTPEQIRTDFTDPKQSVSVPIGDLDAENVNRMEVVRTEGQGALYYTAHLNLRLYADEVDPVSRGVTVTRDYFLTDGQTPITTAQVGDVVTVRLTITAPQSIYYFVLEDPLPAGLESIDPTLLTNVGQADGPYLRPKTDDAYWYWGWWIFELDAVPRLPD